MKITWTITADCDPPPDQAWFDSYAYDNLRGNLEDEVADALLDSGAGASVEATMKVEP